MNNLEILNNEEILEAERDVEKANCQLQRACGTLMEVRKKFGVDDVEVIVRRDTEFDLGDGRYWLTVKFEKIED